MRKLAPLSILLLVAAAACSDGPSGPEPVLDIQVSPDIGTHALSVGETFQLRATTLGSGGDTLRNRTVTWSSSDSSVVTVTSAGLVRGVAPGTATVRAVSENVRDSVVFTVAAPIASCLDGGRFLNLAVGEVFTAKGSEIGSLCFGGGAAEAEYTYIPFFASQSGEARLAVEVAASGVQAVTGPPNPYLAAVDLESVLSRAQPHASEQRGDGGFHDRIREWERREFGRMIPGVRAAMARGPSAQGVLGSLAAAEALVPQVGDLLTLNGQANSGCTNPLNRVGRVAAVTERAIVVVDTANPKGADITDEEYRSFALAFDTLIYPVNVDNFGAPSDIDKNQRVIIFYSRVVNELTPENVDHLVGGFFHPRDLFPKSECAGSNAAEMFYLLAPDPNGEINGNKRSADLVRQRTVGVIAHEFQHLINASRRVYVNNADVLEEVWLNEGLSHIAEELAFYRVTPLSPRENIDRQTALTEPIRSAFVSYQSSNFGRFISYLTNPDTASLMGVDNLPTRGAVWAFLRYAADRKDGPDRSLWFSLVNSSTSGLTNLRQVLNVEPLDWMQDWTVTVYTDDAVPAVSSRFTEPSWNFRSIMPAFPSAKNAYPLKTTSLVAGAPPTTLSLFGGGAAYLRFGVAPSARAEIRATSGGIAPPASLRVSIVRTR